MNQNNCDIARDLMPLSIDGVCSEGSQRFLDAHVAQCPPCRNIFARMKAGTLPPVKPEPAQEELALKQSLRYLGKRFKALWIALAALACAFVLLLVAAGVNQIAWNWTSDAPLDTYNISLYSNDALVRMDLSASFYEQVYNGLERHEDRVPLPDTGEDSVILTYSLSWYPNQHKDIAKAVNTSNTSETIGFQPQGVRADVIYEGAKLNTDWKSDYRFTTMLETDQLCVMDGKLYMIDGFDSALITTGRVLLVVQPGLPVSEIRFTDGKNTKTIYTWGDEIPNYTADWLDEHGLPQSGFISPSDLEKYADLILK